MNDDMNIDKYLDETLKRPDAAGLKDDITKTIMLRIQNNLKRKQEQKKFVLIISSVFITMSVFIVGFIMWNIIESAPTIKIKIIDNSVHFFQSYAEVIARFFPSSGMSIIGTLISLGLFISAWFYFDLNKQRVTKKLS